MLITVILITQTIGYNEYTKMVLIIRQLAIFTYTIEGHSCVANNEMTKTTTCIIQIDDHKSWVRERLNCVVKE